MPRSHLHHLEVRLSQHLAYNEGRQRILEALLAENEDLRKQSISLEMDNRRLQHTLDLDSRRHREQEKEATFSDVYDWVVDIQLLSDVSKRGWRVEYSHIFLHGLDERARSQLLSERAWIDENGLTSTDGLGMPQSVGWRGAVVAVLGLYDKGKTFVLNSLTESKLPSGKKVALLPGHPFLTGCVWLSVHCFTADVRCETGGDKRPLVQACRSRRRYPFCAP